MNIFSFGTSATLNGKGLSDPASGASQGRAQYELRIGAFVQRELEVVSFEGHEKLSAPYVYEVVFASSLPVEPLQAAIFGFPACLSIQTATHEPRVIQGIAVGFESIGAAEGDQGTKTRRYMVRIAPRLWLLNHRRKHRVFQDRNAVQIARAVLEDAGITPEIRLQQSEYPSIPFSYQRGETDLEFLHHVLAVAGIFYYFEHANGLLEQLVPGGGALGAFAGGFGVPPEMGSIASAAGAATTLVLCDRARHTNTLRGPSLAAGVDVAAVTGLSSAPNEALSSVGILGGVSGGVGAGPGDSLPYDGNGQAATASERIFSFRALMEVRPKIVSLRDWSLDQAQEVRMVASSSAAALNISAGLSTGVDLTGRLGFSVGATARLNTDALPIASKDVAIAEYQRDAAALVGSDSLVEHALSQLRSDRVTAHGDSDCRRLAPGYRFQLSRHPVAPLNNEYVVTAIQCRGHSPDHAPADYPHIYRATFDCVPASIDPRPAKPALRPPLGLEAALVVGPDYGDVHCDALGRIQVRFRWAAASTTYAPDAEGTCWVYWLERWAGNGFGTMTLPRVGTEVLVDFLQAEGGRPVAVGQLYSAQNGPPFSLPQGGTRVGLRSQAVPPGTGYSEISIEDAAGQQTVNLRAQGRFDIEVTDDHTCMTRGNSAITVGGDGVQNIGGALRSSVGGASIATVSSSAITDIGQDCVARIQGDTRLDVGGSYVVTAAGDEKRTTGGTLETRVGQSATHSYASDARCVVGHPDMPASWQAHVYGTSTLKTTREIRLVSDASIVLQCGQTHIELSPDGLRIGGQKLLLTGSAAVNLVSPKASLALDDNAALTGKAVHVSSGGAALALQSDATLSGASVKLGSGSGQSRSATAEDSKAANDIQPVYVRVRLLRFGKPAASVPYTLKLDGLLELHGSTTTAGFVEQQVPRNLSTAELTFLDTGEKRTLAIGPLSPVATLLGAQYRLKHLGYYHGSLDGLAGPLTEHALETFQAVSGLASSGQLDPGTQDALQKAYGS